MPAAEVDALLATARTFVREVLVPLESQLLHGTWAHSEPLLAGVRAEARARGLWAPFLPRALGGLDMPLDAYARLSEVLGWTPYGHYACNCQAPDVGNMELLLQFGTDQQKATYLEPLARGEIRSCFAMTEPEHAGSNPVWMSTTAVRDGDDLVITGHKWFTSSADGASFAVVMAVTDADAPHRHARASQILVPLPAPGYTLVRNIAVMGESGGGWSSHAEVRFDGVRVPFTNVLGAPGRGFALAQERLGPGRIHHCMRWIGICERAFDLMCRRAASRELAPGDVLANKQQVQFWIADSRIEIHAARLMVMDAATRMAREGQEAAREEIAYIKVFVANTLQRVLDRAIQAHGALGMTDDTPLAWWYRHERAARIYDGADEVHRSVIARRALKPYLASATPRD
ncbi:MAG: acyl-CoA dehydrogenase family protein [Gemmatimonadota bacterium]|nr:acyl-CoA dehydrogenase family protein [Gemmatimonadota bacterium]MDQ8166169.1 acyl-CoA dehydrogenase family protein [Gemmatimonadota bacterium]MDQ8171193.1 acyl-CoA dehydrogenase family protein [Gemmatimonadota bacterium]